MHIFIVPGIHVAREFEVNLPDHYSVEKDFKGEQSPLRFRVKPVHLPTFLRGISKSQGELMAKDAETCCSADWGDPDEVTVVFLETCKGHSWWTKNAVVSTLRLFCEADIYHGPDFMTECGEDRSKVAIIGMEHFLGACFRDAVLSVEDTGKLREFIPWLASRSRLFVTNTSLAISLRYFLRSYENRRLRNDSSVNTGGVFHVSHAKAFMLPPLEDVVLHLTIALEALLAFGEKNEIAYKVRSRVARLLATSESEAQRLIGLCGWAYGIRSAVAHGDFRGFNRKEKVKSFYTSKGRADWHYIVMCLRKVVRRSLLRFLDLHDCGMSASQIKAGLDDPLLLSVEYRGICERAPLPIPGPFWPVNPRDDETARQKIEAARGET